MSFPINHFKPTVAAGIAVAAVVLASCGQRVQGPPDTAALAVKVGQLEAKLAYLSDRQLIHDVYLHYMRGFDRNDVELMRSAFWVDVQINYGAQSNSFDEFVERHLNEHPKEFAHYLHFITNESVEIDGDVAHAETYVTRLSDDRVGGESMIVVGRYIDRLDRRNGEWRIAVREFIPHFLTKTATGLTSYIKESTWPHSTCAMGTWDKRDPSYRRPLTARVSKDIGPACAE